uniref:Uncharacterized protein n=1 Tax=Macrostomum lignano TaxID=282301 RepID=A0A1I8JNR6_9PLAT
MKCVFPDFPGTGGIHGAAASEAEGQLGHLAWTSTKTHHYGLNKLDTMFSCAKLRRRQRAPACWLATTGRSATLMCKRLSACWSRRRWSYTATVSAGRAALLLCCHCPLNFAVPRTNEVRFPDFPGTGGIQWCSRRSRRSTGTSRWTSRRSSQSTTALNKLDTMFSCAKYDGVRGGRLLAQDNWEKRDLMCKRLSACWSRRWSYSHSLPGGRCYCCHYTVKHKKQH